MRIRSALIAATLWLAVGFAAAEVIQVAVAANFSRTAARLTAQFEQDTGHQVLPISGSTGKHYAQIRNGAPFDVFLAADVQHPEMLENEGLAVPGSRFTYAVGRLVLWSPVDGVVDRHGKVLANGNYQHLAIANPNLAPYGLAARETLEALGLWAQLQDRAVRGENVGQAFQFVASGSAELGFVALSQVTEPGSQTRPGSYWMIPQENYTPIEQQAVLLKDRAVARDFMEFLDSNEAQTIIRHYGYKVPGDEDH